MLLAEPRYGGSRRVLELDTVVAEIDIVIGDFHTNLANLVPGGSYALKVCPI
jgi:hypothetical protein